jgi:hypothetical protein
MGRATNLNKLKLFTPGAAAAFLHCTQSAPPAEMVSTPCLVKIEDFSAHFLDETKEQTETSNTAVAFSPDATCDSDFKGIHNEKRARFVRENEHSWKLCSGRSVKSRNSTFQIATRRVTRRPSLRTSLTRFKVDQRHFINFLSA